MAIRLHPVYAVSNRARPIKPFLFHSIPLPLSIVPSKGGTKIEARRSSTVSIRSRKFVEREIWISPGCTTNSSPNTSPFPSPFEFNRPIRSLNRRNCSPYFTRGPPRFPRVCAHYPWPLHPLPAPLPSG